MIPSIRHAYPYYLNNPILMSSVTTSITLQISLIRACSTTKLLFKFRNIIIEELLGF